MLTLALSLPVDLCSGMLDFLSKWPSGILHGWPWQKSDSSIPHIHTHTTYTHTQIPLVRDNKINDDFRRSHWHLCIESFPWQYIEFFNWPIWWLWFCQLGDFPFPFPSAATVRERREASGSLNTSTIQLTYNGCRSKGLRISSGFKPLC